jgi:AraC family transcriptional regulator, exoenzyme S synthesis regulatory protein ExsA
MQTPVIYHDLKIAVITALQPDNTDYIQYCNNGSVGKGNLFLEENVLLYVLEGHLHFCYGNATHTVQQQQVAFLSKDTLIEYESAGEKCIFFLFVLKNELIIDFAKRARLTTTSRIMPEMVMVKDAGAWLQGYISSLQTYLLEKDLLSGSLVQIKLMELLFCLSISEQSILTQLLNVRERFRPDITRVVEDSIMTPMTLTQLARLAGRSVSSFRRDFLYTYNMPPCQWIRQKRLQKAQQLLISTTMTVSSICYTLGFESVAHFSRTFKAHFGCPPSELRTKRSHLPVV